MEEKKQLLLQVIMELGKFFMMCDGETDEREVKFINDYKGQLIKQGEATQEQLQAIEAAMPDSITFDYLIEQTQKLLGYATEEEREALRNELSSFIEKVIMADEVLHPNEEKYFEEWKTKIRK